MTILYSDPICLEHHTGSGHPEHAKRLRSLYEMLEVTGVGKECATGEYEPADISQIEPVHSAAQIQTIRNLAEQGGGSIDPDTVVSPKSYDIALRTSGAGIAAVDAVVSGKDSTAFCMIRPPGHHATQNRSMGFCLFNTIAVAAHAAKTTHGISNILIVDWDVHHGNGTQDIFYEDPAVSFLSIHRYGGGFYPGTGHLHEEGEGRGKGHNRNVPLRYGISRDEFRDGFSHALERFADQVKPELILLSAGFDAHHRDPVGSLGLESEDYAGLTRTLLEVAKTHSQGRVVSFLEGGYNLEALAECVQIHLRELLAQ